MPLLVSFLFFFALGLIFGFWVCLNSFSLSLGTCSPLNTQLAASNVFLAFALQSWALGGNKPLISQDVVHCAFLLFPSSKAPGSFLLIPLTIPLGTWRLNISLISLAKVSSEQWTRETPFWSMRVPNISDLPRCGIWIWKSSLLPPETLPRSAELYFSHIHFRSEGKRGAGGLPQLFLFFYFCVCSIIKSIKRCQLPTPSSLRQLQNSWNILGRSTKQCSKQCKTSFVSIVRLEC